MHALLHRYDWMLWPAELVLNSFVELSSTVVEALETQMFALKCSAACNGQLA